MTSSTPTATPATTGTPATPTPARPAAGRGGPLLLGATAVFVAAVVAATWLAHGPTDEGLQLLARYTARAAFPLFLLAFTASALVRLAPSAPTRWIARQRRWVGLSFALAQLVHLAAIAAFFRGTPATLEADVAVIGGGIGFAFVIALAATSNDRAVRALGGRAWQRLHRTGIYVLWGIYAFTYASRVAADPAYLPGLAATLGALGLRVAARKRRPRRRPARRAAD